MVIVGRRQGGTKAADVALLEEVALLDEAFSSGRSGTERSGRVATVAGCVGSWGEGEGSLLPLALTGVPDRGEASADMIAMVGVMNDEVE